MQATLSSSGLVTSVFKTPSVDTARLAYIGKAVGDNYECEAKVGSTVILAKNSNFLNKIEGKDYYTVKQQYILGLK
jgi:co-chaperonin GroES (HSP10)